MIERHVETVFCDDLRHEVAGKLSFIGVYGGDLFVQSFPAILPKLCLSVKVVSPASAPLRSLTLRVLKDEDVLRELTLDEKKLETQIEATSDLPKEGLENRIHTAHFLMVFSPFKLDGPCVLRVRAQTGSGELRGVGLRVSAKVPEPVPDE